MWLEPQATRSVRGDVGQQPQDLLQDIGVVPVLDEDALQRVQQPASVQFLHRTNKNVGLAVSRTAVWCQAGHKKGGPTSWMAAEGPSAVRLERAQQAYMRMTSVALSEPKILTIGAATPRASRCLRLSAVDR